MRVDYALVISYQTCMKIYREGGKWEHEQFDSYNGYKSLIDFYVFKVKRTFVLMCQCVLITFDTTYTQDFK